MYLLQLGNGDSATCDENLSPSKHNLVLSPYLSLLRLQSMIVILRNFCRFQGFFSKNKTKCMMIFPGFRRHIWWCIGFFWSLHLMLSMYFTLMVRRFTYARHQRVYTINALLRMRYFMWSNTIKSVSCPAAWYDILLRCLDWSNVQTNLRKGV